MDVQGQLETVEAVVRATLKDGEEASRVKGQDVKGKFDTINKWTFDRACQVRQREGNEDDIATGSCAIQL